MAEAMDPKPFTIRDLGDWQWEWYLPLPHASQVTTLFECRKRFLAKHGYPPRLTGLIFGHWVLGPVERR